MKNSFFNNEEVKKALADFILNSDRFSMGEQCHTFEKNFSIWQQRKHSIFVSSGSMANLILIQALMNKGDLKKGDRVGFSTVTWPTNVMPLIQLGLIPVPIDCSLSTLNITSQEVAKIHNEEPLQALFITNVLGFCDDLDVIEDFCKQQNIVLLEDNCESLGSVYKNKKLGNFGLASTFSTFIGHHLSTIEGGFICTDDDELANHLTMCRSHGWDRNLSTEIKQELRAEESVDDFYAMYTFYELAYNGRPTEIQGFLGNYQLKFVEEIVSNRQNNFNKIQAAVSNSNIIKTEVGHMQVVSNFSFPLLFRDQESLIRVKQKFVDKKVEIRPIIAGNMLLQPFYKKHISKHPSLPNANLVHTNGFYFGNRPDLTEDEIDLVTDLLRE